MAKKHDDRRKKQRPQQNGGDHVTVMAVVCSGEHTRIGVKAPPDVSIMRGEILRPAELSGSG